MADSRHQPQVSGADSYAPLIDLVATAERRRGQMSAARLTGDQVLLYLEYANEIVEDVRAHRYWTILVNRGKAPNVLPYYTDLNEKRAIPDGILIAGLRAYAAEQAGSKKAKTLFDVYRNRMSMILYQRINDGIPKEFIRPMDGGSNPRNTVNYSNED